jgi:dTDP-L-rhamnose 4-epimerase
VVKRVLVTGGCGFIGRHVAAELAASGIAVRAYDALIDQVHGQVEETPPAMPDGVEVVVGDVRDRARLATALRDCDGVIHLAAEVGVGQSMYEIARYVGANDLGTAVLLEALIDRPVRRVVVASSMSVYGEGWYRDLDGALIGDARRDPAALASGDWEVRDAEGRPLMPVATDETKPPDVASIYALTKFMQERAVLIFGAAYGVEAVALRLFNVYGAGQALSNPYTGVLSNFAARVANGRPPLVFEDGLQQRDFVHVRDVARAFRLALQSPEAAGAVLNIGSGRAQRIIDVARLVAAAMDRPDLAPEITGQARSGDIRNCIADISRARAVLGYDPDHTLVNAIDDFVAFVRAETPVDRADEMRRHLEARRLVS